MSPHEGSLAAEALSAFVLLAFIAIPALLSSRKELRAWFSDLMKPQP